MSDTEGRARADIVPLTYTNYNVGISHIRLAGERLTLCGTYFRASALGSESLVPTMDLCPKCAVLNPEQVGDTNE